MRIGTPRGTGVGAVTLVRSRYVPFVEPMSSTNHCPERGTRRALFAQGQPGAREGTLGNDEVVGGPPPLDLRRPGSTCPDTHPPGCRDEPSCPAAREEVAPDDPDHREHEYPQQHEEPVPGDREDDFWQGR